MTQFFVPKAGTLVVKDVGSFPLVRGVQELSDAAANSHEANAFGIKTLHEMTDTEWLLTGLRKKDVLEAPEFVEHQGEPAASSDAPQEEVASGSVSFMITEAQKEQLREHGFSDETIRDMKPEDAHALLATAHDD